MINIKSLSIVKNCSKFKKKCVASYDVNGSPTVKALQVLAKKAVRQIVELFIFKSSFERPIMDTTHFCDKTLEHLTNIRICNNNYYDTPISHPIHNKKNLSAFLTFI